MTAIDDTQPLCFVLMPFGTKTDPTSGVTIDFDDVYQQIIRPAIEVARLRPIRADEEQVGGIIHKPMYERLILCEYAVADLTTANANVYYELGIRHAVRPWSTVLIFADGVRLPFDLGPMRGFAYHLDGAGAPTDASADRDKLAEQLRAARRETTDSPLFQLLTDLPRPDISHLKTDVFRDRVEYSSRIQERLAAARGQGVEAVRQVREELGELGGHESAVVVDLLLSFRAVGAWDEIAALVERMPAALARATLVREQYALALNRAGRDEQAEQVLRKLIDERGPSSETYGILGRVYKDRWEAAHKAGNKLLARGLLDEAIDAYVKGFESDWRDAYPGINAVQLMELREPPDPRRAGLLPVVTYSVQRRIESTQPGYWDHATRLELAVLDGDEEKVMEVLPATVAAVRAAWEPASTLQTLQRLRLAREQRGPVPAWMAEVEHALEQAAVSTGRSTFSAD
jgi:tetratricopeptide (TPR) repeat protein